MLWIENLKVGPIIIFYAVCEKSFNFIEIVLTPSKGLFIKIGSII
jgi:hypothetical protein